MDCTIYKDTFVARQPVFDKNLSTWGYQLLHRHGPDDSWTSFESAYSTATNVLACLPFLSGCLPPRLQTMLHFPIESIREDFPAALNPESTTLIIREPDELTQPDLDNLEALRKRGFQLALDSAVTTLPEASLLDRVNILISDLTQCTLQQAEVHLAQAKERGVLAMAGNVTSQEMQDKAVSMGFDLFHGPFFAKPKISTVRTALSGAVSRLSLFDLLAPDEPDFDTLAQAIEPDVAITHRLLAFLNSAHFSFSQSINSVRQAVVLAGWNPIRNWLRIILITDLLPNKKSRELGYMSAHRAKFLEMAAMRAGRESIADSLFMTGLFSLLDTILDTDMDSVLEHLPLTKDISDSLRRIDGPYSQWLHLTRTIEAGEWDELGTIAMGLNLPPGSVAESYRIAFQWADEFFGMPDHHE